YQFNIVGNGPQYHYLLSLKLNNLKTFGDIPYSKLHTIYQQNDILLFPSLYAEGWGRTAMEAVACGLPVLGSNLGAIPENLSPKVSILFKPTIKNFQKNIKKVILLKKNCRTYALNNFSTKNFNSLLNLYKSLQN
ncbi:hypothetical protein COS53_00495, partial [Candidatus Shapirobacteria bacterium CG03_land_8_20_14_0_80_35_14]